ncbi:RNase H-like domain found in reverse transcriptase [Phytophthora infestans]|uniref:RNase H-like domain found in reverse transcriptase n=1 Tax=Phytophthora infestans TaxID=4787 RepID=A0A8S9TWS7_PHYIN|nr:RNase H-like domain found in reverse transcriptase [Phytophthora infestans]
MLKSSLFELAIKWCGKLVSSDGIRHDPACVDALVELPLPATVADLQGFVFATNWLHDPLPDYARTVAPLHDKLEAEKKRIGRRNRNALQVATSWDSDEKAAYENVLSLVRDSALIAHHNPDAELCVFTDASLSGFGIMVKQGMQWQPGIPAERQNHQLIICKGGTFKRSQLNWTVVEKEAYPIVKACNDLEYLLLRPGGFRLFCDHANLIYIFSPHADLKKRVRDRLQRWAVRLCGLYYRIEHISGVARYCVSVSRPR